MKPEELLNLVAFGLDFLSKITDDKIIDTAADTGKIAKQAIQTMLQSLKGEVSPKKARASLERLFKSIEINDAKADAALKRKFPKK